MDIKNTYETIINELSQNKRINIALTTSDIETIESHWKESIANNDLETLKMILCILENSRTLSDQFDQLIIQNLKINNDQLIIFTLSTAWKQMIDRSFKTGDRLPFEFLEELKNLLKSENTEIVEWTLRTIDQIGPQAIFLKDDIIKVRRSFKGLFDKHQKASNQIVDMLLKRWSSFEGLGKP